MAYGLKYTIPFVDVNDNAFEVRISQDGYTGEPMILDGAPSPFVSRLDDSDDLMAPIRTSTAQISFVDDIDIANITPVSALEFEVELYMLDDEEILKWRGFLRPDIYTQPNIAGPNIVTVNAVSSIEALKGFDMDILDGSGVMPVYEILQRATKQVRSSRMIHFPKIWSNRVSLDTTFYGYAYPFALRISTMIYISENQNARDDENLYSSAPYTTFLEDFCKLFGLTLIDDGLDWYFVKSGWIGDYIKLHPDFLTDARIINYVLEPITLMSVDTLHIDDDSGTVDVYNGRKSVALDIATDNDIFAMQNIEDSVITNSHNIESFSWTGNISFDGFENKELKIRRLFSTYLSIFDKIELIKYKFEEFDNIDDIISGEFIRTSEGHVYDFQHCGAEYVQWDTYNENVEVYKNKKSWSPKNCILINDAAAVTEYTSYNAGRQIAISNDKPIIRVRGEITNISSGAFVLDCDAMATSNIYLNHCGWFTTPGHFGVINDEHQYYDDRNLQRTAWRNGKVRALNVSLKVGTKYFNGNNWVNSERPIRFSIPFEDYDATAAKQWYSVKTNKTIDMPYEGESGYFIPINEPLFGTVELCIYHSFTPTGRSNYVDGEWQIEYLLDNFRIAYVNNIDYLTSSDRYTRTKFFKLLDTNAPDELKLDLNLHGEVYADSGTSRLFSEKYYPVRVIQSDLYLTATAVQIEQQLLDTLVAIYEKPSRRYSLGINYSEIKPFDIYVHNEEIRPYVLTGYEVDWAEHHADVKLSQVAKFAPITAIMEDTANETQG